MAAVLYGNFRVELLDRHGTRLERLSLQTPVPPLRFRDLGPPPPPGTELLGRSGLLAQLARAVRPGWALELRSPCGFGKSSLLAALAASLAVSRLAPVVTVRVGSLPPEDVLDQLFGALYTADPPVKPSPEQRGTLLAQTRAVVVLDDVDLEPDQVAGILATLPQCLVLVGAERPVVGAEGVSLALEGLGELASLQLLARDLGRPLEDADHDDAVRLCAAVRGQPLRLRQAATLAAAGQVSLRGLAVRAERDPRVLDRLTVHRLSESERRVLGVLALAAGAVLPGDLVETISGVGDIAGQLGRLRRHGLVEQEHDRFGLPRCLGEGYRGLLLANLQVGASVQPLITWLRQRDPTSSDALAGASAAVELLGVLAERAEWEELARLAEVTARVLTLAGRWETCRRVLEEGLEAARQVGDLAAQARFSHDLGSMQLCSDNLRQAHDLLTRALELRQQRGDREGAALTRHNLALLSPPAPPTGGSDSRPRPSVGQRLAQRARRVRQRLPALLSLAGLFAFLIIFVWRTFALPTTATSTTTTTHVTTTTTRPGSPTTTTLPPGSARTTRPTGPTGPTGPGGPAQPGFAAPSSVRFPSTAVGGSATRAFQVTSTGTGPLRLDDFELDGDRADFTADRHCRHVLLSPSRSCQITVQFRPTTAGSRRATLTIHQNLPGPPSLVRLAGTGVSVPSQRFTVTVEVEAGADLRVTSDPPGIDCPGTCQSSFPGGTTVALRAVTGPGTVVWAGDCVAAADACTLVVDGDRHVLVGKEPEPVPPDLVPGEFAIDHGGGLAIPVSNQGKGDATASTTEVRFGRYGTASVDTPGLAAGASTEVHATFPSGCFDPDCEFTIVVDATDQVLESDEGNNSVSDSAIG
jgi:hypothetical protein